MRLLATLLISAPLWAVTWGPTEIAADADDAVSSGTTTTITAEVPQIGHWGASAIDYGWRWTNITVPNGATINSATISVIAGDVTGTLGNITATLYGDASDNASAWADTAGNRPYDHATTTASASWASISVWTAWTRYNLPSVTSIVQEIVNRAGWASGNAMRFSARGTNAPDAVLNMAAWSTGATWRAELTIDYTAPAGGSVRRRVIVVR